MREILFRGKTIGNEWVYGNLSIIGDVCFINEDMSFNKNVIPETVGQYTGLTDKNGKKIFEGDIVKFAKNLFQITFECGSFALLDKQGLMIAKVGGMNDHCYSLMELHLECCWKEDSAYDVEVLGNIHDNPELLKGGAE